MQQRARKTLNTNENDLVFYFYNTNSFFFLYVLKDITYDWTAKRLAGDT